MHKYNWRTIFCLRFLLRTAAFFPWYCQAEISSEKDHRIKNPRFNEPLYNKLKSSVQRKIFFGPVTEKNGKETWYSETSFWWTCSASAFGPSVLFFRGSCSVASQVRFQFLIFLFVSLLLFSLFLKVIPEQYNQIQMKRVYTHVQLLLTTTRTDGRKTLWNEYLISFIATEFSVPHSQYYNFLFQLLTERLFPVHVNFTEVGAFHWNTDDKKLGISRLDNRPLW